MIISIEHKGLRELWMKGNGSKLPADQLKKIKAIMDYLDMANTLDDINFPGSRLHPLKGHLKGYWALTAKANWRIIFQFQDGNVYLVDYLNYH